MTFNHQEGNTVEEQSFVRRMKHQQEKGSKDQVINNEGKVSQSILKWSKRYRYGAKDSCLGDA